MSLPRRQFAGYNHHHPPLYKIAKPGKRGMYGWDGRLGWTAGMDEVRSKFKVKNAKASRAENTKRIAIARTWACRQTPIDACCRVGHAVTSNGLREMAEAGERDISQHEKMVLTLPFLALTQKASGSESVSGSTGSVNHQKESFQSRTSNWVASVDKHTL